MKSKATLFLMEQLVMVLVFALAAALCLGVFARADEMAEQITKRDEAVNLACNAAELLKATGDPAQAERLAVGALEVKVLEEEPAVEGLRRAVIRVFCDGEEIFALRTGWQEVAQ